jgi:hypothetical protein
MGNDLVPSPWLSMVNAFTDRTLVGAATGKRTEGGQPVEGLGAM